MPCRRRRMRWRRWRFGWGGVSRISEAGNGTGCGMRIGERSGRRGGCDPRGPLRDHSDVVLRVMGVIGTKVGEESFLEGGQHRTVDVQFPIQVSTHLPFHLVDFAEAENILSNDTPGLVRVGIVTDNFGSDHERRNEKAVARRSFCGRKASLETLEENQRSDGYGLVQFGAVESICDKKG